MASGWCYMILCRKLAPALSNQKLTVLRFVAWIRRLSIRATPNLPQFVWKSKFFVRCTPCQGRQDWLVSALGLGHRKQFWRLWKTIGSEAAISADKAPSFQVSQNCVLASSCPSMPLAKLLVFWSCFWSKLARVLHNNQWSALRAYYEV